MKLLQNRVVALIIAAAVMLGSTLVNVNSSLSKLNRRYEKALSAESGSVISAAESCAKQATLLLSVFNGAPAMEQDCETLREAAAAMRTLSDPVELSEAAEALLRQAEKLEDRFEELPGISERDEDNAEYYWELLEESCERLTESELMEALAKCREGWSSPVARLLTPLLWTERPAGL